MWSLFLSWINSFKHFHKGKSGCFFSANFEYKSYIYKSLSKLLKLNSVHVKSFYLFKQKLLKGTNKYIFFFKFGSWRLTNFCFGLCGSKFNINFLLFLLAYSVNKIDNNSFGNMFTNLEIQKISVIFHYLKFLFIQLLLIRKHSRL